MTEHNPSSWPSPAAPAPPPALPATPVAEVPWSAPAFEQLGDLPLEPATPARRGKGRIIAGIAGVGALLVAGGFAVNAMQGGDGGGADSPEAAVQALVDAVNEEDVLGALDVVLPGERDTFKDPLVDVVEQLRRIEVVGETADLGKVGGLDLELVLTDVQVDAVADDIAVVDVSGTATTAVDTALLPIGDLILDQAFEGEQPAETTTETNDFGGASGEPLRLATVERDGRWYVSLWYTVAENARQELEIEPAPSADQAIVPDGGESPEQAMDQFLARAVDLDLEGVIAMLNPNEAEALQRYAPLFLGDTQQGLDDMVAETGLQVSITDVVYETTVDGDTATIVPTSFSATAQVDGETIDVAFADGCATLTVAGEEQTTCIEETEDSLGALGLGGLTGIGAVSGVTLDRVDGQWYVSPIGTAVDGVVSTLEQIERSDIDGLIEGLRDGSLDPFGLAGLGASGFAVDSGSASSELEPAPGDDPAADCFMEQDVEVALECMIAAQVEDPDVLIPPILRFPECGLAERYWSSGWADLGDAEFIELITSAHDCFMAKVAAGEMDEFDLPAEVADPLCYGGVNLFAIEDVDEQSAALDEFYDCVFA